jgi:hypothetical protein
MCQFFTNSVRKVSTDEKWSFPPCYDLIIIFFCSCWHLTKIDSNIAINEFLKRQKLKIDDKRIPFRHPQMGSGSMFAVIDTAAVFQTLLSESKRE